MPTLAICDKSGALLPAPQAEHTIGTAMRFPGDVNARRRMPTFFSRNPSSFPKVEEDPKLRERGYPRRVEDGLVAAHLLGYLLTIAQSQPRKSTFDHAAWIMSALPRDEAGQIDRYSRGNYFQRTWREMRYASHLWLAFFTVGAEGDPFSRVAIDARAQGHPANLMDFLALAEHFRKKAETTRGGPARRPLLDARRTWKAPTALTLPPAEYELLPLTDHEHEALQSYTRKHFRR
jgi:hypothetical protein